MDEQTFINKVKGGAVATMKKHGILASITIAQAILESGWGESQLTKTANNLFGIKRWGYPEFVTMPTTEYINGQPVEEQAEFRKYPSWDYSIADHTAFLLQNDRYKNLIGVTDYKQVCSLIQQDGYATDPGYSSSLIEIIEDNELHAFDSAAQASSIIASIQNLCNGLKVRDSNGRALTVDGLLGPSTKSAIFKLPVIRRGSKGNFVKWVQTRLIDLGFNCGACGADGHFGYCTLTAVQNLQSKHGIKANGIVDHLTLGALIN